MDQPTVDPRTPGQPVSWASMANRLYNDAGQERVELLRLSALAQSRPDLAPLIEILVQSRHRRSATAVMLGSAIQPEVPPRGWWERVRMAWKMLFPGR